MNRYALASDVDCSAGIIWSTGGVWSAGAPDDADLMSGPQVQAFASRNQHAVIVDVVVYKAAAKVWQDAFRAAITRGVHGSTAREAGRDALRAAGYGAMADRNNPFNPCEV